MFRCFRVIFGFGGGAFPPLFALLLTSLPASAQADCAYTLEKYQGVNTEGALRAIVAACPGNAAALNNLAVKLEESGRLDEAKTMYERAIEVDPAQLAPYAGLGDVLSAQQKPGEAVEAYRRFLDGLAAARASGTAGNLTAFEGVYRARLAQVQKIADRERNGLVPADRITRSLTTKPIRTRGLNLQRRREPHIDIQIRFDFNSARLSGNAFRQIDEIAKAVAAPALSDRHIVIEGHTDSKGPDSYNRNLSIKRAVAVRTALMERGIEGHRLSALGFGETRPIADNTTAAGQAANRRVTFVNMGKR